MSPSNETSVSSASAPHTDIITDVITPRTNRTSPAGTSGCEPGHFFLNRVPLPVRERPVRLGPKRPYLASYSLTSDEHLAFIEAKNSKKAKCPQGKVNGAQKARRIKEQFKNGSANKSNPKGKQKCKKDTVPCATCSVKFCNDNSGRK